MVNVSYALRKVDLRFVWHGLIENLQEVSTCWDCDGISHSNETLAFRPISAYQIQTNRFPVRTGPLLSIKRLPSAVHVNPLEIGSVVAYMSSSIPIWSR